MKKGNKIKLILFLTPFTLAFISMWFIILYNVDYSDENFIRDHYKWKLERYKRMEILCELYNDNYISGKVINFKSPLGAGPSDILTIKIDKSSDIYEKTYKTMQFPDFEKLGDILVLYLDRKIYNSKKFKIGTVVKKNRQSEFINFIYKKDTMKLKFFFGYEDEFKNCIDLDTMNILWNYNQFIKYNNLSRRQHYLNEDGKKLITEFMNEKE